MGQSESSVRFGPPWCSQLYLSWLFLHMICLLLCLFLSLSLCIYQFSQAPAPGTFCLPESCASLVRTLVDTQGGCQLGIQFLSHAHYVALINFPHLQNKTIAWCGYFSKRSDHQDEKCLMGLLGICVSEVLPYTD